MNEDKGGIAKKNCSVACIGCTKCFKVCPHGAITMKNNLAFIDSVACKLCRKCAPECPTNSILEIGFPVRKEKATESASGIPEAKTGGLPSVKPGEMPAGNGNTKEIDA